jgi:aminoglycoside phosphotransferase
MDSIDMATAEWLSKIVDSEFVVEKHGYSNQDAVFTVRTSDTTYYLKIASDLKAERHNIERLEPYLLVPKVVGFDSVNGDDHLLMSEVPGKNLAELVGAWTNEAIVREFARSIKALHDVDAAILFPGEMKSGLVLLHGDMALPNIISTKEGSSGYIDLGKMALGTPDFDLADAVWSLQRNMGPGYGELLLEEYGAITVTPKLNEALGFRYTP